MTALYWLRVFPLLLGCFLPGYLLTITWPKDWTEGLTVGERVLVPLLAGLILSSWLLLFLAELEVFSLAAVVAGWIAICAALGWVGRHEWQGHSLPKFRWSWTAVVLAAILLLAAILFARPAESFLVLDDAGIYTLGGIQLAETGKLFATDSALAALSPETARELLFTGPIIAQWSRLWGQFFLWNWNRPWVSFGLLHMQRLWCGLFTLFLGRYGGLWVAPAFGLIAILGLYALGRRLFSPHAGAFGALLLTLNLIQLWHARYPLSEMLAQAYVIGGFYLLALGMQKRHVWLSALAGLCLGGLFLARVDAVLIAALCLGLTLFWRLNGYWQRHQMAFALSLGLALVYATFHNMAWAWAYLISIWQIAGSPALARIALLGGLCAGGAAGVLVLRPGLANTVAEWLSAHTWPVATGALSLLVGAALFSYAAPSSAPYARATLWLTRYWTPLGTCLAAGGLALILWRRRTKLVLPLLTTALVYLALFSLNPMVNSVQPWAMRRFVPTVLPVLALLTGYVLDTLPPLRWQMQRVVQVLMLAALTVIFLRTDLPFLTYTEYEGMGEQIRQLAERFEDNAMILFDQGNAGLYVAQPLAYLHHLNTFVLQRPRPDSSVITPWIESWQQRGVPVYLVLSGDVLDWHPPEWAFVPRGTFDFNISRIQRSVSQIPQSIENIRHSLDIYQVLPSSEMSQETRPRASLLNMGAGEYPYLGEGFYGYESTAEGLTYRWTDGLARIQLPRSKSAGTLLRLRVAGGRPAGVSEARLSILVNGTAVASEYLPGGFAFQTLEFILPSELLDTDSQEITVELQSNPWAPLASGYGADSRELGVVVDWIECVPSR